MTRQLSLEEIERVLKIIDTMEYFPLIAKHSQYFRSSDFAIYKCGIAPHRMMEFNPIAAKLKIKPELMTRELQLYELFIFDLRDNCYVEKWDLNISSNLNHFHFLPLRLNSTVAIKYKSERLESDLDLKVGHVLDLSSLGSLTFKWERTNNNNRHSVFAVSWSR